jgi:hypothetical protein
MVGVISYFLAVYSTFIRQPPEKSFKVARLQSFKILETLKL